MVDIDRVGSSIIGNEYEGIGDIANSNLKLDGLQMVMHVSEKIHWLQYLKCFCMCVHGYHVEKEDVGIAVTKYCSYLSEKEVNTLRPS